MGAQCTVCGELPVKSGFFNIRFDKCPVCSSVYMDEDALVGFIQASRDNPGGLRHFPEREDALEGSGIPVCRACGQPMKEDSFVCGGRSIRVFKCGACKLVLLYPMDLYVLNEAIQEEKRKLFQDALSGR